MTLASFVSWCAAHPLEALALLGAALSVLNGALPASVQRGPVGRALHLALDRVAVLSRSDAAGTLKWPGIASVMLAPPPPAPLTAAPAAYEADHPQPSPLRAATPAETPSARASQRPPAEPLTEEQSAEEAYQAAKRFVASTGELGDSLRGGR